MHKIGLYLRLMRPKHWLKNAFVLAPLLFAVKFNTLNALFWAIQALVLFCLVASLVYVINDIADCEKDRRHPLKCKTRPLAAGDISIKHARLLAGLLFILCLAIGWHQPQVLAVAMLYLFLNILYTFWLKKAPIVDIFLIATGFMLRVYAGALAIDVPLSAWMLITVFALSLYLASSKRLQEIINLQGLPDTRDVLAKYNPDLLKKYTELSANAAIVFYCMFVLVKNTHLVMTLPFVLFGIFRYMYVISSKQIESPTDALLLDYQLLLTVISWGATCTYLLMYR